jgi:hypothetical protein
MLRTDLDNCITMSQTVTDPNTGQNTTVREHRWNIQHSENIKGTSREHSAFR